MNKEMYNSKQARSIAVLQKEFVGDKRLVIACGYNKYLKFGYFICKEHHANDLFEYTDFHSFYPKVDENTYQIVLEVFKELS